jgi:hypothetical protein
VEVASLADPRHFNFVALDGQRVSEMSDAEEVDLESRFESVSPALA